MLAGSLFSGVGGLDEGLRRAGFEHAFFAESDHYRRAVLAHHWPGVPIHDDVRSVGVRLAEGDNRLGPRQAGHDESVAPGNRGAWRDPSPGGFDLLCGGFPCQDVSVAGNRAGLAGARSGLFHEFARVIDIVRPRAVLVENVPGLLSSNGGRDFGVVVGTLAELGYGVGWRVLDSRFFGVPQRRRRVFIIGVVADGDPRTAAERCGQILAVGTRCPRHPATRREAGEAVAGTLGNGTRTGSRSTDLDGHGAYIMSAAFSENQRAEVLETPIARQLTSGGGKPGQGYPAVREGIAVRRLTPRECERLQAFPDDWTQLGDTPDSRRYAAMGDAVTVTVAHWLGQRLYEHLTTPTPAPTRVEPKKASVI